MKHKRSGKNKPPPAPREKTAWTGRAREAFNSRAGVFSPILVNVLIGLLLVLVGAGVVSYKIHLLKTLPYFDPADGRGFFWTESAFHFRHFMMVAEGRAIPAVDYGIQSPEGLDTVRYITPVMERVAGTAYRLFFSELQPHLFAAYFSIIFSTLSVVAIFLAAAFAWRSRRVALASALLYGFTLASLARSAGGGFIREDFALPFIFASLACFLDCLRRDRPLPAVLGSMLLVVALYAWHVTQLYLSLFVAALAIAYFLQREQGLPRMSLSILVAFLTVAALCLPVLRAKYFIFSPALMLGYALLALVWTFQRRGKHRKPYLPAEGLVVVGFLGGALAIQSHLGTYSHVFALLLNKIIFWGSLPQDAGQMPFEAKAMWTSAFVSPRLSELPLMLSFSLVFGALGTGLMMLRIFRRQARSHEVVITLLTVWMFLLFLMIHRMSVFAVFFLVLSLGALTVINRRRLRRAMYAGLGLAIVVQFFLLPGFKLLAFRPNQADVIGLLSFVESQTEKNSAVLTVFELGPSVALYARRPVILHSKFESKLLRDKVEQVYTSLYRSEETFYELCQRLNAGYFVYQVNMVTADEPGSLRYLSDALRLRTDSAAFKFHFFPEQLVHFRLIYQNATYRVFGVGQPALTARLPLAYEPVYDPTTFFPDKLPGDLIERGDLTFGLDSLRRPETYLKAGDRFFAKEDYQTAAGQYERALMLDPRSTPAIWSLVRALAKTGDADRLTSVLRTAINMDPDYDAIPLDIRQADIWMALARDEMNRTRFQKAAGFFQKALEIMPASGEAYFGLGTALLAQDRPAEAETALLQAVAIDPRNPRVWEYLGKAYAVRRDVVRALDSVENSLALNPRQPQLEEIRAILQEQVANKKMTAEDFEFYFKSGNRKARSGDFQAAIDDYRKALAIKKTAALLYNLGLVSHRFAKNDDAVSYLRESLAINPANPEAKSLLKYLLSDRLNAVAAGPESANIQ
jgi:tetratricopeptide (TPR) repeat protein